MTTKKDTNYEITEHLEIEQVTGSIRRGHQSINYDAIYKATHKDVTKKLKVEIRRDSITSQSYAKISVWSAAMDKWNEITCLMPQNSPVFEKINPYEEDPGLVSAERRMKILTGTLINTAAEVIF